MSDMNMGRIVRWFDDRGFGFIRPDTGDDIFVHVRDIRRSGLSEEIKVGDRFRFEVEPDPRGVWRRGRAVNLHTAAEAA